MKTNDDSQPATSTEAKTDCAPKLGVTEGSAASEWVKINADGAPVGFFPIGCRIERSERLALSVIYVCGFRCVYSYESEEKIEADLAMLALQNNQISNSVANKAK